MTDNDKNEAEQRLLTILLEDEFEQAAAAPPATQTPRHPQASTQPRRLPRSLLAAGMLMGLLVVTLAVLQRDVADETHGQYQDPKIRTEVEAKDFAAFCKLLDDAEEIRLVPRRMVGAVRTIDDNGRTVDRLENADLPHIQTVSGEQLDRWTAALLACKTSASDQSTVQQTYVFEIALKGSRILRASAHWNSQATRIWAAGPDPIHAGPALDDLFDTARTDLLELTRVANGTAADRSQLQALPLGSTRLDVSAELLVAATQAPCAPTVEHLAIKGNPDPRQWDSVGSLPRLTSLELVGVDFDTDSVERLAHLTQLRALVLRNCAGLSNVAAARLAALRNLKALTCIDTRLGGDDLDLSALASLPKLRSFGMKVPGETLTRQTIEVLLRTKLHRLVLVDVAPGTDLAVIGELPSLQRLTLVGPITDTDLEELQGLRTLERLVLRNTKLTDPGVEELRGALPDCTIDWRTDQRWFDTDYAFEYEPPAVR